MEWEPFNASLEVEKDYYLVKLPSGEVVSKCWPNDCKMNATDRTNRSWDWNSGVLVKPDEKNLIGWD